QRDQGSARLHGPAPRHGSERLAAGQHRRARQALRGALLSSFPAALPPGAIEAGGGPPRHYRQKQETAVPWHGGRETRREPCVTVPRIVVSTARPSTARRCSPIWPVR